MVEAYTKIGKMMTWKEEMRKEDRQLMKEDRQWMKKSMGKGHLWRRKLPFHSHEEGRRKKLLRSRGNILHHRVMLIHRGVSAC